MKRARLDALERHLRKIEDGRRIELPPSDEGRHRTILDGLASLIDLTREAFGEDDPRANAPHLRTLTYHELLDVYRDAMNTVVERNLANGSMDWFKALPLGEKVRLCRQSESDGDEIGRLRREYEARRHGRLAGQNGKTE